MSKTIAEQHVGLLRAFANLVEFGHIRPVAHGYCWSCDREGLVYELTEMRSEPSRCPSCMFTSSLQTANEYPEKMTIIEEGCDCND